MRARSPCDRSLMPCPLGTRAAQARPSGSRGARRQSLQIATIQRLRDGRGGRTLGMSWAKRKRPRPSSPMDSVWRIRPLTRKAPGAATSPPGWRGSTYRRPWPLPRNIPPLVQIPRVRSSETSPYTWPATTLPRLNAFSDRGHKKRAGNGCRSRWPGKWPRLIQCGPADSLTNRSNSLTIRKLTCISPSA